ncbi:helix-turn-helix transcriptional regulator [Vibrio sp. RE86]|uniref:helix-turn-helix transcriptional regulator n=1 Tax=Vibrio sp. RE86 TaxID=2607605 RepID=UPI0014935E40|nr:helix-turn-helix transcriptional regulator [Vibrio sp. RE86]NOH78605.1 helix-turn-helix transcriptional regulator [Vibrio sp. RE86]
MIALINKYAAITFIDQLNKEVTDAWSLVREAHVPIYLDTSTAQFTSFAAFIRLLEQTQRRLPASKFIALLQLSAHQFVEQLVSDNREAPSLQQLTDAIPVESIIAIKNVDTYSVELAMPLQNELQFLAELYLLVTTHCYCIALNSRLTAPVRYHLQHPDALDFEQLQISNHTPQYLGQQRSALFYKEAIYPETSATAKFDCAALSFCEQLSAVLEGYIGREDLSIEQISEIIGINQRTIQRRLKSEGCTFRKLKETLNFAFAKRVMVQRNASISDVAEHLGYADTSQFIRAFKKSENITPLQWLKKAQQA